MSTYGTPSEYGTATYGAPVSSGGGGSGGGGGMPAILVEVAFETDPPFMPIWTDISEYVRSFSTKRGRQFELDRMQTGVAQLVLDNQDRRFDPTCVTGAYYPNVKPMKRLRIHAVWGDSFTTDAGAYDIAGYDASSYDASSTEYSSYPVFTGYVEEWPQAWSANGREAHVSITVLDGFVAFGYAKLNRTYPQETSSERIKEVLDDLQWGSGQAWVLGDPTYSVLGSTTFLGPVGDRAIGAGTSSVQASTLTGTFALDHLMIVVDTENGLLFVSKDGAMTFRGRHGKVSPPYNTSQVTFGDGGGVELPYSDLMLTQAPIWNEVILQRVGGEPQTAENALSELAYFKRTYQPGATLLHTTDAETLSAANWTLSHFKDPNTRVAAVTIQPRRSANALWPQVLTREIGDRVTVVRRPPGGGSPISQESYIEGVIHQASPKQWTTQYWLSAADSSNYMILGDPTTGVLGVGILGY